MRPKRSNDPVQAAHQLYLEIIGEAAPQPIPENTRRRSPCAVARLRAARSERPELTPERRREIAQKAAAKRWNKPSP